jgi:hypothetical protein
VLSSSSAWTAVLLTAAGCFGFKLAGWSVPSAVLGRPVVKGAATLLPVALLAALVVVQVFGHGRSVVLDARAGALVAGAVCLWRRLPFLVVVVVAAATAALVRAW